MWACQQARCLDTCSLKIPVPLKSQHHAVAVFRTRQTKQCYESQLVRQHSQSLSLLYNMLVASSHSVYIYNVPIWLLELGVFSALSLHFKNTKVRPTVAEQSWVNILQGQESSRNSVLTGPKLVRMHYILKQLTYTANKGRLPWSCNQCS